MFRNIEFEIAIFMHLRNFTFLFFLGFIVNSFAQTRLSSSEDPVTYGLKNCIDYAWENNVSLRQSELRAENSINNLSQSRSNLLPTFNGQFSLNSNFGRNIDPFSNTIVTQTIGTNRLGVGSSLLLYNGYRLKNTISRNELDLNASQLEVLAQKNTIALQVAVAYLNVLSAEDQIEVAQKNVEVTNLQLDRTKKLVSAGALPETNIFDLNAQLANDELQLINAENNKESTLLSLKQAMNLPANTPLQINRENVSNPDLQTYPETAAQVYQAAIGFLPDVKAAQIREEIAQKNIEIANSVGLPSISLSANWGTAYSTAAKTATAGEPSYQQIPVSAEFEGQTIPFLINFPQQNFTSEGIPYARQIGNNQNMNVGVSMNIPIFNGNNKKYQVQSAKIQKMQSELNSESTRIQIRQNIDQAYINMLNSKKTYTASLAQVEALQRSMEAAESRYNAGAGTFVDYNLARTNLDRALANQIRAKYDFIFRVKILDFYQNKPLDF